MAIPASLKRPCARPAAIPDRDVALGEATRLWLGDRSALKTCGARHAAFAAAVDARDQLQGR